MAVKERKQITGTTAQIQAYKGHEGQIVWDKEKKTLVGMSGTAGKNYPLAPQAYVDNEVSKVNTSVTQGLAGKEDKGVCLPKSGGSVSGKIVFTTNDTISRESSLDHALISGGTGYLDGASLALFGKAINDPRAGGFELYASKGYNETCLLQGLPDGNLYWANKKVPYIVEEGRDFIKYSNGLMICTYQQRLDNMQFVQHYNIYRSTTAFNITFPIPFASRPRCVTLNTATIEGFYDPWLGNYSWDATRIYDVRSYSCVGDPQSILFTGIAYGRW